MRRSTTNTAPSVPTPEAELAGLVHTRATLQARYDALKVEVDQAVAARRALLIEGGGAAALAEAERICREFEGTAFGIADALAEVERRIAAAEERISEARVASERENTAAMLERQGDAIDGAAERVRQAISNLASATTALASAISPQAAPLFAKRDMHGLRDGEPPERIAVYLVGHMLATAIPQIEVSEASRQERFGWVSSREIEATDGDTPEKPLLTSPMRDLATRVRSGEASPAIGAFHRPEPEFAPSHDKMAVFVTTPFSYIRKAGYVPELVMVSACSLPVPVARRAIERGVAFEDEPGNWQALRERARTTSTFGKSVSEFPTLGFNLEEWRQTETERNRQAWMTEQGREAA